MKIDNIAYDKEHDVLTFRVDSIVIDGICSHEHYEIDNEGDLVIPCFCDGYHFINIDILREIIKLYDKRKTLDK
jgi:hypothetical protein